MGQLEDYTCEFRPNIKFEEFSKDIVIKLLKALNKNYLGIDGFWFQQVTKEDGLDKALAYSADNWEKQGKFEIANAMKILNIHGNDVETFFKAVQFCPSLSYTMLSYDMDLKSKYHGVITIHRCPAADFYESLGEKGISILSRLCHEVEIPGFKALSDAVNPDIRMTNLKLPPRKGKTEACCQWEFMLEAEG